MPEPMPEQQSSSHAEPPEPSRQEGRATPPTAGGAAANLQAANAATAHVVGERGSLTASDDEAAHHGEAGAAADASPAALAPTDPAERFLLDELRLPSQIQTHEPLEPGTRVGPEDGVEIVEHLGTLGRMHQYAALWRRADAETPVQLREGPGDDLGLVREAEALAAVQYAMLPQLYLTWEHDGRRYLALEPLQGETLAQALHAASAGLPTERALSLILQLVQVVRRLHRAGWAVLGLTPADVVLGQPLHLVGLRYAGRIGEPAGQAFQLTGSSAPELAFREPVTGKEDVYSLGALLFHALTGQPLPDAGADTLDLPMALQIPGAPQLLADVLVPADERIDIDTLYQRLLALKARHAQTALRLVVASATSLGLNPTRHVNEDSCGFLVASRSGADGDTDVALLCVTDGMGGMEAGEIASQTALDTVMSRAAPSLWRIAPDGPSLLDPAALVRQAATAVHAAGQGRQLGTTITVVAVHGDRLTLGHVGDTRAYLLRNGELIRLTADHSLVAAMVASGVIEPEEAEGHPDSNKVLRSLGSQRELPAGYVDDLQAAHGAPVLTLRPDDWLLLCSDGVWGSVPDPQIRESLLDAADPQAAARELIDRALAAGAPDNATALVARCLTRSTF
jgi:PPM family protein phosphatase